MKAVTLAALVLAACGSASSYRTTRIAPSGHTQWLFGAQVSGAGTVDDGTTDGGAAPLPEFALAARRGFSDRFEAQANATLLPTKIGQSGSLELAGKALVGKRGRASLAVGAGAGYHVARLGGATIEDVYASVPVIGGIQLVLSIDGGYHRLYSSGARPVNLPYIGESIGFLWQLGKNWAVLPEVGGAWTPTANFMTEDSRLFHVGIAAMWTH